jgi:hypothetical protein
MGFLDAFGKILQGKPVYDGTSEKQSPPASDEPIATPQQGSKYIPVVRIGRIEVRQNGQNMDIEAYIKNESQVEIGLDKVRLLGGMRELDTHLQPGQERKFHLYSGGRPSNTSRDKVEVWYLTEGTADYFSSVHVIEFFKESDNTFSVRRIRFLPPIKDM